MAFQWQSTKAASMLLNEVDHRLNGRSSSAAAKYADAVRRGIDSLDQFLILLSQDLVGGPKLTNLPLQFLDAGLRLSIASNDPPDRLLPSANRLELSALVSPGRWPAARPACWNQTRRLSGEQPSFGAIARYAAVSLV